ncbi:hypothetical protein D3C71_1566340 [compost metagenome]
MTAWVRSSAKAWAPRLFCVPGTPGSGADAANSTPTATKLSQKPGCHSAQGSVSTTAASASSQTWCQGQRAPARRSAATTASIRAVRCAGRPQPLSSAYISASSTPPHSAAVGAGSHRHRPAERRQARPSSAAASQANSVMCRPEMLIRCATPVARNSSQSRVAMACWSPTTSAATTPRARCQASGATAPSHVARSTPDIARSATMASRNRWRSSATGWCQVCASRCGATCALPVRT